MEILADSGILLRLQQRSDPQHPAIRAKVTQLVNQGDRIVVAPQNLAEFWNVCTRPSTARGGYGLDIAETDRRLSIVEAMFGVLYEPPGAAYFAWRHLVVSHRVHGKEVHDARLVALMRVHSISHILTLNGGDFARYPGITVLSP